MRHDPAAAAVVNQTRYQAAGLRNANRIPRELVGVYRCHIHAIN